ncbi:MAG TPA: hypothetical protein VNN20_15755 [Thermodesulfobacteriota bacterium]|nr:hypothetical protein [Thermodesulfobacteriota bacterium]
MDIPILYQMPTLVIGLFFAVILLAALEVGYRIGRWRRKETTETDRKEQGDLVLTSMYALLGLMLAFTYTFTLSRADLRKQAVINEANAIGTAFLRAGLAPEPYRTELREALLDYAKTRVVPVGTAVTNEQLRKTVANTLQALSKIWPLTEEMVKSKPAGPVEVSIVQSINEVIDMNTKRLAVSFDRLPGVVLLMLLFIASAAVAMTGLNAGLSGRMNRWGLTLLILVLAFVMLIITDFDRPIRGFVQVSQQSLVDVIQEMENTLAK